MMRLTSVSIRGLFGIFDHDVALNTEEKITIITAPNGFGKTLVLRVVNLFFRGAYSAFLEIEFDSIVFYFSDSSRVEIFRKEERGAVPEEAVPEDENLAPIIDRTKNLFVKCTTPASDSQEWEVLTSPRLSNSVIEQVLPQLSRLGPAAWYDRRTGEHFNREEVRRLLDRRVGHRSRSREPDWLRSIRASTTCRFIETQRLLRVGSDSQHVGNDEHLRPVVSELAKMLASSIRDKLTEYGAVAQSLESNYPHRLITKNLQRLPEAELRRRLLELDEERAKFMQAGLLDKEDTLQISSESISPDIIDALSIYVVDTQNKLAIFKDLFERIEIFQRILNKRLQYKSLFVDREVGFGIRRFDGVRLQLQGLSSGEQHELVLMYELLFNVREHSLILIDEPELSLHVAWQSQFLDDIKDIIAIRHFDVVIATHSPQIISDRWDLAVELQGPRVG